MPSEIHDFKTYKFSSSHEVMFDANIWIYLQGPPGEKQRLAELYTQLLTRVLTAQSSLVIAPLILSEFINRFMRLGYDRWMDRRTKSYKEFRQSSASASVLIGANESSKEVLTQCKRAIRYTPSLEELQEDMNVFATTSSDFNDLLLARICREENLILVTHDEDFRRADGLTIITANRKMLES